jgi:pyridoxamine 5'-phosphate oxidase family protein
MFSQPEAQFLKEHSLGRLATISPDGLPHLVPVGYAFDDQLFYASTKPGTKKIRNLRANPHAAFLVDEPGRPRRAIMLQCLIDLVERGEEWQRALSIIVGQRGARWGFQEGEQIILRMRPTRKVSWGLEVPPPS